MHAIGSMVDSEYLHATSALNLQCQQTQIGYICITVIKKLNNERLGKFASTGVRL